MIMCRSLLVVAARSLATAAFRGEDLAGAAEAFASTRRETTAAYNRVLASYARAPGGRLADARHLFDRIPRPDAVSYNTLLSCHFAGGDVHSARELFSAMPARDVASWNTMVSGLSRNGAVEEARAVLVDVTWSLSPEQQREQKGQHI